MKVPQHMKRSVALARQARAKNKHLDEVRFALGVSIVGAIRGAGDLDELFADELRILAEEVEKLLGFIKEQLKGVNDG